MSAPSHFDIIEEFRNAMAANMVFISGEIIADGKIHRVRNEYLNEDQVRSKNAWYKLFLDTPINGMYGCNKRYPDQIIKWTPENAAKLTPEERAEIARIAEFNAAKRAEDQAIRFKVAAEKCQKVWGSATAVFNANHPYLERKQVQSYGLKSTEWSSYNSDSQTYEIVSDNALIVPLMNKKREIRSLQAIFPSKDNILGLDKLFISGGEKKGLFFPIGKKPIISNGAPVFILAEGYATAATIHAITGHLVLTCFDAGNLVHVAESIHSSSPSALIVIAADNDQWTVKPMNNPGLHYANIAADNCNGRVAIPDFSHSEGEEDENGKLHGPTDFNDLFVLRGYQAVKKIFDNILSNKEFNDTPPDFDIEPSEEEEEEIEPHQLADDDPYNDDVGVNPYYTVLGYDESNYWFFQREKGQVLKMSRSELSGNAIIELAPLQYWESYFPAAKSGFDAKSALNRLFREANYRGVYDPNKVRGRGAWLDESRLIFHFGNYLNVKNRAFNLFEIKTDFVYPKAKSMPEVRNYEKMSAEEGRKLIEVAKMVRWSKPGSVYLFCGWIMLAPICGILKWRPHVWLTGKAGSGKSVIQASFAGALLKDVALYAQGSSTEPGIRQTLKMDAIPVLIDEIEPNDENDRKRVESILSMIRQSSSETQAKVMKGSAGGSAMSFLIRSMFCLASINTQLNKKSDIDRLTKLYICHDDDETDQPNRWEELAEELHKMVTDNTLNHRFLSRCVSMMDTVKSTVENFTEAAAAHFGSQRYGDQFGTLLAGAWCFYNDNVGTANDAKKLLNDYDWREHTEDLDEDDADQALSSLLGSQLKVGTTGEWSIYELIRMVSNSALKYEPKIRLDGEMTLSRYGIKVDMKGRQLLFGVSVSNLHQLVTKFSFGADLKGQLRRISGANKYGNKTVKFNGIASRVVAIPLDPIIKDDINDDFYLETPI